MNKDHRKRLQEIQSFPSLVKYLREDLDWPIKDEPFEELIFDYRADGLQYESISSHGLRKRHEMNDADLHMAV